MNSARILLTTNRIGTRPLIPGAFDVLGIANAQQTVSVNGTAVDYRRGEYFQKLGNVNNTGSLVWTKSAKEATPT